MKKQLINEVKRFQKIAGINEMRVGPDGSIMDEEGDVKRAFQTRSNSFSKIINALHKDPSYQRAKEALHLWIKDIAEELGIAVEKIPMNHLVFTGRYPAVQALPVARKIFTDLLTGDLQEDDYDMGTPSGDTDGMNIAEAKKSVEQVIKDNIMPLRAALQARRADKEDIDAHDNVKNLIIKIATEVGIPDAEKTPWMEDEMFSGDYKAAEVILYLKDMLEDYLSDSQLDEDDFSDTSRGLDNTPLP